MAITTAIPATDRATRRPATSWCHTHGRSWSSGLLLRLTNGLAAVSTKERKGGDGARRWIEGGSKNGPFLRGNSALPPRCCTHDVLHRLQMAKSCRNSASLQKQHHQQRAGGSNFFANVFARFASGSHMRVHDHDRMSYRYECFLCRSM